MPEPDVLRVVEAGYRFVENDAEWLDELVDAASPFAQGSGVAAFEVTPTKTASRVGLFVERGAAPAFEVEVRTFDGALDAATVRSVYAPTEFVGNAEYRVRRIARDRGLTFGELTGGARLRAWALVVGDPRARALLLAFPGERKSFDVDRPFPHARLLGLAGAHLGAALRLRTLARGAVRPDDEATESVLTPDGRVLHATGDARAKRGRLALVEAVAQRERARGRLRRVDAAEAAALWSVLVDGRWTIIDFTERDGKRLLLARKNPVRGPDVLSLTVDERDVLWLATHGHSHKYIGYELGISPSAVVRRLSSAMRKLRVPSRRELLRVLGSSPTVSGETRGCDEASGHGPRRK